MLAACGALSSALSSAPYTLRIIPPHDATSAPTPSAPTPSAPSMHSVVLPLLPLLISLLVLHALQHLRLPQELAAPKVGWWSRFV